MNVNLKKNPEYYFMFLGVFSAFFSINALILNPVYISGLIVVFISFLYFNFNKVDKFYLFYLFYFVVCLLGFSVGLYFFDIQNKNEISYLSSMLYLYCILLGAAIIVFGSRVQLEMRKDLYRKIYNFLVIFMGFDLIARILMATHNGNFYDYKWGIFYFDSNFTGTIILLFLTFSIYLKENNIYDIGKFKFLILIFLLLGTFSRAAIFAFFLTYFLFRYSRKFINILAFLFFILSIYIFNRFIQLYLKGESFSDIDGSFNSKFYLISVAIDNYDSLEFLNKIFGIGLANFISISDGLFAHNIIITFFYEFGFWGIAWFIVFMIISYLKVGKDILYIFIPFFIVGFSLFSAYMPFFFVLVACMYVEKKY